MVCDRSSHQESVRDRISSVVKLNLRLCYINHTAFELKSSGGWWQKLREYLSYLKRHIFSSWNNVCSWEVLAFGDITMSGLGGWHSDFWYLTSTHPLYLRRFDFQTISNTFSGFPEESVLAPGGPSGGSESIQHSWNIFENGDQPVSFGLWIYVMRNNNSDSNIVKFNHATESRPVSRIC